MGLTAAQHRALERVPRAARKKLQGDFERQNQGNNSRKSNKKSGNPMNNKVVSRVINRPVSLSNNFANSQQTSVTFSRTSIFSEVRIRIENQVAEDGVFYKYVRRVIPSEISWICNIAKNYDRYKWNSVQLRFVTATSTDSNGTAWFGFDYENTINSKTDAPTNFLMAQQLDRFTAVGVGMNSPWINCPKGVLSDRWFLAAYDPTDPAESCPMSLVFGLNGVNRHGQSFEDQTMVGYMEIKYSLILSRPSIGPLVVSAMPAPLDD